MHPLSQLDLASRAIESSQRLILSFLTNEGQYEAFVRAENSDEGSLYLRSRLKQYDKAIREEIGWFYEFAASFTNLSVSRVRDMLLVLPDSLEEYTLMTGYGIGSELSYLRGLTGEADSLYLRQAIRSAEREVIKLLPELKRIDRVIQQSSRREEFTSQEDPEDLKEWLAHRRFDDILNYIGSATIYLNGVVIIELPADTKATIQRDIASDISLDLRASMDMPASRKEAIGRNPVELLLFLHEIEERYGFVFTLLMLEQLPLDRINDPRLPLVLTGVSERIRAYAIPGAGSMKAAAILTEIALDLMPEEYPMERHALLRERSLAQGAGLATDEALASLAQAAKLRGGRPLPVDLVQEGSAAVLLLIGGLQYDAAASAVRLVAYGQPLTKYQLPAGDPGHGEKEILSAAITALHERASFSEEEAKRLRKHIGLSNDASSDGFEDLLGEIDQL